MFDFLFPGLKRIEERLIMDKTELLAELNTIKSVVTKIGGETSGLLAAIQAYIDAGNAVSPEVEAAVAAVRSALTGVDDLVPDVAP